MVKTITCYIIPSNVHHLVFLLPEAIEAGIDDDKEKGLAEIKAQSFFQKYGSCRWIIAYLTCLARLSQTAQRQFIGMSVVCMQDGPTGFLGNESLNGTVTMELHVAETNRTHFQVST